MSKTTSKFRSALIPLVLAGIGTGIVHRALHAERRRKLAWLRSTSHVFTTARGSIEYGVHGHGAPLLFFHGGMGGYEQGLALAEMLDLNDYMVITFSRPGYRRTSIALGGTLPEQAEAACSVLDHLGVQTATVIALSAGGMAALQFAQDHPERCRALVLLSAQGPELSRSRPSRFWLWLLDLMLASDLLVWVLMGVGMSALTRLMRADSSRSGRSVPRIRRFFAGVFPASDWRVGTSNDVDQLIHQKSLVLRNIRVPTLVLHGTQDVIVPLVVAEDNAAQIPRARLIMIAGGSHVMMATHAEEINKAIRQSTDLERSG